MAPTNNNTTWTAPRTWTTGELVTASMMNTHVRDNLTALHVPAGGYSVINAGADLTTTSTSFGDADSTNLSLTFTTGGGDVLVFFCGTVTGNGAILIYFDYHESVSGGRIGGDDGLVFLGVPGATTYVPVTLVYRFTSQTAVSHTYKLQWKVSSGTATIFAGAGTSTKDVHPTMFAFEI